MELIRWVSTQARGTCWCPCRQQSAQHSDQSQHSVTQQCFVSTHRVLSQRCTGPRWIRTWWCRGTIRAWWSVTGSTPETLSASSLSPGPSSASPAPLTPGTPWLSGKTTTEEVSVQTTLQSSNGFHSKQSPETQI